MKSSHEIFSAIKRRPRVFLFCIAAGLSIGYYAIELVLAQSTIPQVEIPGNEAQNMQRSNENRGVNMQRGLFITPTPLPTATPFPTKPSTKDNELQNDDSILSSPQELNHDLDIREE